MWSCFRVPKEREPEEEEFRFFRGKTEEIHFLENGARILEEMITSFDGRSNPIRSFSKQELEQATNNYDQDGVLHQTEIPTLVYEFAASGCLSDHIFGEEPSPSKNYPLLSWESRLRIATEIADAVAYLHSGTSKPIIHRLINSKTIFLDQHYVAKLFEFGFSISIPLGETHVDADEVVGYTGFIAPDTYSTGQITEKFDVYSFGMVLCEILTGKRVHDVVEEVEGCCFCLDDDNEKDMRVYLKANILKGNTEQLMACAELAIRCIKMNREERPSMMEAAKELRRIRRFQHDSL